MKATHSSGVEISISASRELCSRAIGHDRTATLPAGRCRGIRSSSNRRSKTKPCKREVSERVPSPRFVIRTSSVRTWSTPLLSPATVCAASTMQRARCSLPDSAAVPVIEVLATKMSRSISVGNMRSTRWSNTLSVVSSAA